MLRDPKIIFDPIAFARDYIDRRGAANMVILTFDHNGHQLSEK